MTRTENLLGAQALAIVDRMLAAPAPSADGDLADRPGASEAAALVTLLACPGQGVGWLAGVLGLTNSGGTRLVERLAGADLVERQPGADARSRTLRLTATGEHQARRLLAQREAGLAACLDVLTNAERATLEGLLAKVVAGLAEDRASALRVCRLCDRDSCAGDTGRGCPLGHTTAGHSPAHREPTA